MSVVRANAAALSLVLVPACWCAADKGGHTRVFQQLSELKRRVDAGEDVTLPAVRRHAAGHAPKPATTTATATAAATAALSRTVRVRLERLLPAPAEEPPTEGHASLPLLIDLSEATAKVQAAGSAAGSAAEPMETEAEVAEEAARPTTLLIGRGEGAHVRIDSVLWPKMISREHAVLTHNPHAPSGWALASRSAGGAHNGTAVNGVAISAGEERTLASGDIVRLGPAQSDVRYRLVVHAEAASHVPQRGAEEPENVQQRGAEEPVPLYDRVRRELEEAAERAGPLAACRVRELLGEA